MDATLDYGMAFMIGVLGSGHCLGMCGSLVSAFFVRLGEQGRGLVPVACYHLGRIGVYGLVGLAAAALGMALVSTGLIGKTQAVLQIVAGLVVILLGLDVLGVLPRRLPVIGLPAAWAGQVFFRAAGRGPALGSLLGGIINGLMPCSMTLAMAVKASSAPHPVQGGLLMLAFGVGTLPAMALVSVAFSRLGHRVRSHLLKAAAVVVIVLGMATLAQGVRFFDIMRHLSNW